MGKKVKILILMGMTISLLSCSIKENSKKNLGHSNQTMRRNGGSGKLKKLYRKI